MRPYRIYLVLIPFLPCFWPACVMARQPVIDSLEAKLGSGTLAPTERIDALNALSREFVYISFKKSFALADSALRLSIRINYPTGEAHASRILASLSTNRGLYGGAYQYLEKTHSIFMANGDSVGMASYYITLGHLYKHQKKYAEALHCHEHALRLFEQYRSPEDRIAIARLNQAECEMLAGDLSMATRHLAEVENMLRILQNHSALTVCYRVEGMIAFKQQNLPKAKEAFLRAVALTDSLMPLGQVQYDAAIQVYLHLAQINQEEQDKPQELDMLKKAIFWANREEYPRYLREAYLRLASFYLRENQATLAHHTLEHYRMVDDSITIRQNEDLSNLINSGIRTLRMETEITRIKAANAEKEVRQQTYHTAVAVIALIIVIIILTVMLLLFRERDKLNRELWKKNEELQTLNATKDKFFSIVAHDLKSPIKALQGVVGLVARDALPAEAVKTAILSLDRDLGTTLAFADNLILWAKSQMENRPAEPQAIPVAPLFESVTNQLHSQSEQKQIALSLHADEDVMVWCDPYQLEFVVRNLVNNAIKFTWPGGKVEVFSVTDRDNVCLLVRDNGVGVAEDKLPTLFDVGTRSTPGTAGEKGTGLGLVLCKEFVEKNRGTISVDSKAGKGATFTVCFPKA